eukprot:gene27111-2336_t
MGRNGQVVDQQAVGVGDQQAVGVRWDPIDQPWNVSKAKVVGSDLSPVEITSVEPQVLCLPKRKEPIQLTLGASAEVISKLQDLTSDLQLRARYMKRAVPLDLEPLGDMEHQLRSEDNARMRMRGDNTALGLNMMRTRCDSPLTWRSGRIGYTPAALAAGVAKGADVASEKQTSADGGGNRHLKKRNGACVASPLSGGMAPATSLYRATRTADRVGSDKEGPLTSHAADKMHSSKGVALISQPAACINAEKGVAPAPVVEPRMVLCNTGVTALISQPAVCFPTEKGVAPALMVDPHDHPGNTSCRNGPQGNYVNNRVDGGHRNSIKRDANGENRNSVDSGQTGRGRKTIETDGAEGSSPRVDSDETIGLRVMPQATARQGINDSALIDPSFIIFEDERMGGVEMDNGVADDDEVQGQVVELTRGKLRGGLCLSWSWTGSGTVSMGLGLVLDWVGDCVSMGLGLVLG